MLTQRPLLHNSQARNFQPSAFSQASAVCPLSVNRRAAQNALASLYAVLLQMPGAATSAATYRGAAILTLGQAFIGGVRRVNLAYVWQR